MKRGYEKWWSEVRNVNPDHRPETASIPEGRFQQDVFRRLRRERDDKPIVLAE